MKGDYIVYRPEVKEMCMCECVGTRSHMHVRAFACLTQNVQYKKRNPQGREDG